MYTHTHTHRITIKDCPYFRFKYSLNSIKLPIKQTVLIISIHFIFEFIATVLIEPGTISILTSYANHHITYEFPIQNCSPYFKVVVLSSLE